MSGASSLYEALPSATSIRVLVLGPGETDDEDIFCWLLPSDLDQDHEKFPDSTPRPTESISIATGKTSSGEDRTFLIPFDVDFGFDQPSAQASHESRMHPFQRYEALSYVWGDNSKPRYIFCNGEELFPVTQNLYAALRSLRLPQQGRRLWIDAICINQADHEEKGAQIGLMDRVYQQASKVIAFLPLSEQDAGNILELVPKVWRAREEYEQKRKERETGMTSQPGDMASLNSVTALETIRIPVAAEEQRGITSILQEQQSRRGGGNFLEDFGIPPLDSPLWVSWQRLFASSYFRRIWILQEFALGKNLHFWFGSRGERAELVMLAKHFLAAYGGTQSSEYMSAGSRRDEDDFTELARRAGEGSNNAGKMFTERVFTQDGSIHRRLIDILSTTLGFQATDQRDKIYALLGLALDGAYFAQHVSYAPEETPAKTFTRFARLFIEKGEGHELLLQAGLEHDQQLPSWVPDWANPGVSVGNVSLRMNKPQHGHMQVLADDRTLLIRGAVVDQIEQVSTLPLGSLTLTEDGVSITKFVRGMVRGFLMIFSALGQESWSVDDIFESLFNILAQPTPSAQDRVPVSDAGTDAEKKVPVKVEVEASEASSLTTNKSTRKTPRQEGSETGDEDMQQLRSGFSSWLSWIVSLAGTISTVKESELLTTLVNSPEDFHAFQKRAMGTTVHRRFCITKERRIGLVPERAEMGDCVAIFEGSGNTLVLRSDVHGSKDEGSELGMKIYRLIGNAYFHDLGGSVGYSPTTQQDILLI